MTLNIIYAFNKCPKCGREYPDSYNYCTKCPGQVLTKSVQIPDVVGWDKDKAIEMLKKRGFNVEIKKIIDYGNINKVLNQNPNGTIQIKATASVTVKLEVGSVPPYPKWIKKIESPEGWVIEGKGVGGIYIDDSLKTVIDSFGQPDEESESTISYVFQNCKINFFLVGQKVDTITLLMNPTIREKMLPAINYIKRQLEEQTPDKVDNFYKAYYKNGISLLMNCDTIIGFQIYKPRREPRWFTMLKKVGINLETLSADSLSVGMYADSIKFFLGNPDNETKQNFIYEYNEAKLIFSIVGNEIDTIIIHLNSELLNSKVIKYTNQVEFLKIYGKPDMYAKTSLEEELIYSSSGFSITFADDTLKMIKMYLPEYYNMVLIPAGNFILGTSKSDIKEIKKRFPDLEDFGQEYFQDEMPQRQIFLNSFYIDKYEVTNRQFLKFVKATGYMCKGNWQQWFTKGKENHPVRDVYLEDAEAYARWAGKRIPTEIEWEKAARCSFGYWFPWGNHNDVPERTNFLNTNLKRTVPVDSFENGKSCYGVYNMSGNVREWCSNIYLEDYYNRINSFGQITKRVDDIDTVYVARGGSYCSDLIAIRTTYRHSIRKELINTNIRDVGFRCVKDIKLK